MQSTWCLVLERLGPKLKVQVECRGQVAGLGSKGPGLQSLRNSSPQACQTLPFHARRYKALRAVTRMFPIGCIVFAYGFIWHRMA